MQSELGRVLRDARLARGLRQTDVARSLGVSHSRIGRVERGALRNLSLADAGRHGAGLGLRLFANFYPTGGGLRDAAQLALLRRFHLRIGDSWRWHLEAPLNIPGDQRANRAALRSAGDLLTTMFPLDTKQTLVALLAGDDPGANGIVLL